MPLRFNCGSIRLTGCCLYETNRNESGHAHVEGRQSTGWRATALAVLSPTAAYASTFSWNWHRSGNTVAYANLSSSGGSTYVREVTGWCGPGEGADVHGPYNFSGSLQVRLECRWSLRDVTVQL